MDKDRNREVSSSRRREGEGILSPSRATCAENISAWPHSSIIAPPFGEAKGPTTRRAVSSSVPTSPVTFTEIIRRAEEILRRPESGKSRSVGKTNMGRETQDCRQPRTSRCNPPFQPEEQCSDLQLQSVLSLCFRPSDSRWAESPPSGKPLKNGVEDPKKMTAIHGNPTSLATGTISAQFSAAIALEAPTMDTIPIIAVSIDHAHPVIQTLEEARVTKSKRPKKKHGRGDRENRAAAFLNRDYRNGRVTEMESDEELGVEDYRRPKRQKLRKTLTLKSYVWEASPTPPRDEKESYEQELEEITIGIIQWTLPEAFVIF
ncbi:hypothetical protein U1Q18_000868 [Sarracenia purpurea var. burkii]